MGLYPRAILTPEHTLGVNSPAEYRARQAQMIVRGRKKFPKLNWRAPYVVPAEEHLPVYVDGGRWAMPCSQECGNLVVVHADWRLGCCCECGAVYENVVIPANRAEIEAVLILRKMPATRGWLPTETVDDLKRENTELAARGLADRERR